jgi:transcriptional regulator with XRE-family HTH domain
MSRAIHATHGMSHSATLVRPPLGPLAVPRSPTATPLVHIVATGQAVRPDRRQARDMDLGDVLRTAREAAGLSQREVGDRVGVPQSTVSRWEIGRRPVRSDQADSVLAACGQDVRFSLVKRHTDLDELLHRLSALGLEARLRQVRGLLATTKLDELQRTGGVVFGGAWAAAVLGMPALSGVGALLVSPDAGEQAAVAAVLDRCRPMRLAPGGPWAVVCDARVFERNPDALLTTSLLGEFEVRVVDALAPEVRVHIDGHSWRLVEPACLVPAYVDQLVLDRWTALRTT